MKTKEIIFFDGDGTLWYPKQTKRKIAPHWIYNDPQIGDTYKDHLVLTPSALATLKKLKKRGVMLIMISTHPHPCKEADVILDDKIQHFKLEKVFDEIYTARNYQEGKGEVILKVLKQKSIPKPRALMVGDSYRFDYLSARRVGVDALLIKSEYMHGHPRAEGGTVIIENLAEIIKKYIPQSPSNRTSNKSLSDR